MNTEIIVALIGMAATAWAPTATAYISRNKELKLKKLEIYQQCKKEAYIEFSTAFSKIYRLEYPELSSAIMDIINACHHVLIYCSNNVSDKVIDLIDYANSMPLDNKQNMDRFKSLLYETMQLLNAEIKEDSE